MSSYSPAPGDTLIFENNRIRVWSMTLEANGGMYDFHQHHHDHLILWPHAGEAEAQDLGDDDWPLRLSAEPGFCLFKTVGSNEPLTPHRIRNLGDKAVTHYIVEFISEPSPSPTTLLGQTNDRGVITGPGVEDTAQSPEQSGA